MESPFMSNLLKTIAIIATAACAGIGLIFILLVFLYKPDNVERIETVLDNYHRPKSIDTSEVKEIFSAKLPHFDFNRTTTEDTTRYSFHPTSIKPIPSNASTISLAMITELQGHPYCFVL